RVHRQRIRRHPPPEIRRQEPLPKIRNSNLLILLLPRKSIVLPEPLPPRCTVVALRRPVRLIGRALDELTRRLVDDDAGGAEVVADVEEDVAAASAVEAGFAVGGTFVDDAADADAVGD